MSNFDNYEILITITAGRRPRLLIETIDSILANCLDLDLIKQWIVIDDQTDEHNRKMLAEKYSFITFINKTPEQKGHAKSLNMLRPYLGVLNKYHFHMEDDFKMIRPQHCIRDALEILEHDPKIGEVCLQKNWQEFELVPVIGSKKCKLPSGKIYYLHEFLNEREIAEKVGYGRSMQVRWPAFSLQPSIVRWDAIKGSLFDEQSPNFERDYGWYHYMPNGWKTAFLPYCTFNHIGRAIGDTSKFNCYELLSMPQGDGPMRQADNLENY